MIRLFLIIFCLTATSAFAGTLSSPPILRDEPVAEQQYFKSIYDALQERSSIMAFASSGGVTVAASTTTYAAFFGGAFSATNWNSTSGKRQHLLPFDGVAKNLYIRTTTAQPADGSIVFTVRKNAVDTAITITISASGGADTYTDITNQVSFDAGDLIDLKAVNSSASASATINQWSMEYVRR